MKVYLLYSTHLTMGEEVLEVLSVPVGGGVAVVAVEPLHEGLVSAARVRRVVLREHVPHCTRGGTGLAGHGRVEGVVTGGRGSGVDGLLVAQYSCSGTSSGGGGSSRAFRSQSVARIVIAGAQVAVVRRLCNDRIARADGAVGVGEGRDGALCRYRGRGR